MVGKALLAFVERQVRKIFDPHVCLFFFLSVSSKSFQGVFTSSENCTLINFYASENRSSVSGQAR